MAVTDTVPEPLALGDELVDVCGRRLRVALNPERPNDRHAYLYWYEGDSCPIRAYRGPHEGSFPALPLRRTHRMVDGQLVPDGTVYTGLEQLPQYLPETAEAA